MTIPCARAAAALTLGLSALVAGCASGPACRSGESASVHDTLYFGTARADGSVVSPAEWAAFVDAEVTPRFPDGFTVIDGAGQWRGQDGAPVREASHVLQVVHPDEPAPDAALQQLIAAYKQRFGQESVLRVRVGSCVAF